MSDKPTPEQIRRACDLANAGCGIRRHWFPSAYGQNGYLTALANTIAQLDAETARAERAEKDLEVLRGVSAIIQAERDKARADLAEIDRIAVLNEWDRKATGPPRAVSELAAPYKIETDPLVECLKQHLTLGTSGWSEQIWADMAKSMRRDLSERGPEIGRSA